MEVDDLVEHEEAILIPTEDDLCASKHDLFSKTWSGHHHVRGYGEGH
jgi:hypothetical protein